jgi:integrase
LIAFLKRRVEPLESLIFQGVTPHDFRRSGIRNMVRAGVPEKIAMSISGHKTCAVFDRYDTTGTDDVKDAIKTVTRYNEGRRGSKLSASEQYKFIAHCTKIVQWIF